MIIPSIDVQDGQAVQLVGGRDKALDAGDPRPLARRFARVGEVAVIDLDAALGRGSNAELIRELLPVARCRVGGGIRDVSTALDWLDAGAEQIILGTAASPEVLGELPRERVVAALDAEHGEVVTHGWRRRSGETIEQRLERLAPYVGGFLITFVEREGRLGGIDVDAAARLVQAAGDVKVTVAGGVTTLDEVAALDAAGADAQVGMALYTGKMDLADALAAPLVSDRPDGLWPTVVVDERGTALGLVFSNHESLRRAVDTGNGVYWSRNRGLWVKGETSGAGQELLRIDVDCDRDALRFTVRQHGDGFCHLDRHTCWGTDSGLDRLQRTVRQRLADAPAASYTGKLLESPAFLRDKLAEEAGELAEAGTPEDVAWEAADVIYLTSVAMARAGVTLADVERELDRRARKARRRDGSVQSSEKPHE